MWRVRHRTVPEAGSVEAADTSKAEKTLDDDADSTFDRIVRADG